MARSVACDTASTNLTGGNETMPLFVFAGGGIGEANHVRPVRRERRSTNAMEPVRGWLSDEPTSIASGPSVMSGTKSISFEATLLVVARGSPFPSEAPTSDEPRRVRAGNPACPVGAAT